MIIASLIDESELTGSFGHLDPLDTKPQKQIMTSRNSSMSMKTGKEIAEDILVPVWTGATGWVEFPAYGKGSLLPPYDSATTLTETLAKERSGHGDYPRRPEQACAGPAKRAAIRRMCANGIPPNVIAVYWRMPLSRVRAILAST